MRKILSMLLFIAGSATSLTWADGGEFVVFQIRNDQAYASGSATSGQKDKQIKVYKPNVPLPTAAGQPKRTTELLIGNAPITAVEKDYIVVKIPDDLKGQVAKGDIFRLESVDAPGQTHAEQPPAKRNYIFAALQLFNANGDRRFLMGELGFQRIFDKGSSLGTIMPEAMSLEFKPLAIQSPGFDQSALAVMYKFSFYTTPWFVINTGIQLGIDRNSSSGGGLIGGALVFKDFRRLDLNVEWLYRSYIDTYVKLRFPITETVGFLMQSGVLSLNGYGTRTDAVYNSSGVYSSSVSTYEKFTNMTYFTAGLGFQTERNIRMIVRGGLAGEKIDTLGIIARAEIGFLF